MAQVVLPPGPRGGIGAALRNIDAFRDDDFVFIEGMRQYGALASFMLGPFRMYMANTPEAFRDVLVTQAEKMHKSATIISFLYPLLGPGLFTSDGEIWKAQHKMVTPSLHMRRIARYAEVITGHAQHVIDGWKEGDVIDVNHAMPDLLIEVICKILFNADAGEEVKIIEDSFNVTLTVVNDRLGRLLNAPAWMPTAENRRFKQALDNLYALIDRYIAEHRAVGEDQGDVMSMVLAARYEDGSAMTDSQLRAEVITLFGAGHETTASTLIWAWYLIAQHPDVEARLHAEIDSVLGGRAATFDDLPNLQYTEQIVKETMRLYPPTWGTSRDTVDEAEVAGYKVPKGTSIFLPFYALHRDPAIWDEPTRFNPDRFSPENEKSIPKYAYMPFGAGTRYCPGSALGMMEAKLTLATIAQRFRLEVVPGQDISVKRVFTLRPKNGLKMALRAR